MQQTLSALPVPYYRGASEAAFGMEPVTTQGNTSAGSMRLGAWASRTDGDGVHPGCIGVLVDDITAYAALTARAEGRWGVTSSISVDFHAPLLPDTTRLYATAELDYRSYAWGHSSGRVTTEAGDVVATIGQRMRYIPGDSSVHDRPGEPMESASWLESMDALLTPLTQHANRTDLRLNALPGMKNPLGTLHGGVALSVCELAARTAWVARSDRPAESFNTSSLRVSYLRPSNVDKDLMLSVTIIHASRSVVLAEVLMVNASGETTVHGTSTLHRCATRP